MRKGTRGFRGILFLSLLFLSCSSPTDVPGRSADVDGTILNVFASPFRILLKGNEECGIVFTITPSSRVMRLTTVGSLVEAKQSDLSVGTRARGWVDGPVLTSCPGQAAAEAVLLLP